MPRAYIGVGSNVEPRLWYVRAAILSLYAVLDDVHASSIYETDAEIVEDQPDFLNAVVSGVTALSPYRLLDELQAIERRYGRRRESERRRGPRTVDLDLILYGSRVSADDRLTVPHPGAATRAFVLVPLLEIAPALNDPVTGRQYRELYRQSKRVYREPRKLYTAVKP